MRLILSLILSAALLVAAPPTVSQASLDSMVRHWQKVLRLQDWDIKARTVRLEDLPEGTMGASHATTGYRVLQIAVLDPQDYQKAAAANDTVPKTPKEILADIEDTVVHELVHLRLRDLVIADQQELHSAEEVTVNRITAALLRGGK